MSEIDITNKIPIPFRYVAVKLVIILKLKNIPYYNIKYIILKYDDIYNYRFEVSYYCSMRYILLLV